MPPLRAARPHVLPEPGLEPPRPPVRRVGVVGHVQQPLAHELHHSPRNPAGRQVGVHRAAEYAIPPGRTSPTYSTGRMSAGATTSTPDACPTAPPAPRNATSPTVRHDTRNLEPSAEFTTVRRDHQSGTSRRVRRSSPPPAGAPSPPLLDRPDEKHSEHPPANIAVGQAWVTHIINAVMRSPDWSSTAIFLTWDDWGGFYDHVVPPASTATATDCASPDWSSAPTPARATRPSNPQLRRLPQFIEDDFLHGQRLNPTTDGRPDSRPTIRENAPHPRQPRPRLQPPPPPTNQRLILPTHPHT